MILESRTGLWRSQIWEGGKVRLVLFVTQNAVSAELRDPVQLPAAWSKATSKYRGIALESRTGLWRSQIWEGGKVRLILSNTACSSQAFAP